MDAFLVSFVVSGAASYVVVRLALEYRLRRRERIQAPIAEALWAEGEELRRDLRRDAGVLRAKTEEFRAEAEKLRRRETP